MPLSDSEVIVAVVAASVPTLKILELGGTEWYRKPKNARRGPWLQAKYEVLDHVTWNFKGSCIYFVRDSENALRYVGISINRFKERWRTSPPHTVEDVRLPGQELFHSQCWPAMCTAARAGRNESYVVSVLSAAALCDAIRGMDHRVSHLSHFPNEPEIAVLSMEFWICRRAGGELWNKAYRNRGLALVESDA